MATAFTNQATLTMGTRTVNSNVVVGQIEDVLTVTKITPFSEYNAVDRIIYAVNIINKSDTALNELTLTDNLGEYEFNDTTVVPLEYVEGSMLVIVNGVRQPSVTVNADDELTVSDINIPAGGNATVIYAASLTPYASLQTGATITNIVTVASTAGTTCQVEGTDEETITAANAPQLALDKSISPVPVAACGEITYTFVLSNSGNTAVLTTDNAVITDTFDPLLSDISVTLDGAPLEETTDYTYDDASGLFTTAEGAISIPAATFEQNEETGEWTTTPGTATLVVTGTIAQ